MNTLEQILQKLGSKKPFIKNGNLSKSGLKAYNKLADILVCTLTLIDMEKHIDTIENSLNKIINCEV